VLLTTFSLTVLVDLTVAISVGMVLAAFLFIRRMATVTNVNIFSGGVEDDMSFDSSEPWRAAIPPGVSVFEISGPFFFGAVETFRETLEHLHERPRILIIRMRDVHALDSTGLHALKDVLRRSRGGGSDVMLADVRSQPRVALTDSGLLEEIGAANVFHDMDDAIARAYEVTRTPAAVSRRSSPSGV
jgi:SulP family sulfate permease